MPYDGFGTETRWPGENDAVTIDSGRHWEQTYAHGDTTRSWYQAEPRLSLRMLERANASTTDSLIDVGGGASTLVDALLNRRFEDVTVLDLAGEGLHIAQQRLGSAARAVTWLVEDLLAWEPSRTFAIWHDRAVLHFLTSDNERERYVRTLTRATRAGSLAIVGVFALDGPDHCSGLPVRRCDLADLAALLGDHWRTIDTDREEHTTPAGTIQPFTWASFRRRN